MAWRGAIATLRDLVLRRGGTSTRAAVVGALSVCAFACPAKAEIVAPEAAPSAVVQAPLDQSIALRATGAIGKVVVSQPEIVEVKASGADGLYVIGRELGTANLLVYDKAGRLTQNVDVRVGYDAHGVAEMLAAALPDEPIQVTPLASGLLLEGKVSNPGALSVALQLAERAAPGAVASKLTTRGDQIRLDVRIFEAGGRRMRDIGSALALSDGAHVEARAGSELIGSEPPEGRLDVRFTPGRFQLDATLQALEARGQIEILAQPTLVSLSGEPASFRAGGEVPYPVPDGDSRDLKLEFKPYGTALTFQPDVQPNGLIRMTLDAEQSELDPSVGLRVGGFVVPGLMTRRATTTLEMRDGESYLIAGLLETTDRTVDRGVPIASRAPVLGPLLKALQRNEDRRELAIVVTAHVVRDSQDGAERVREAAATTGAPESRTPRAVSAPRGPPVQALAHELKQVLGPPVRWAKRQVLHALSALRLRH